MLKKLYLGFLLFILSAPVHSLEVELKQSANSLPISDSTWAAIRSSLKVWNDLLGFEACYLGKKVTVSLNQFDGKKDSTAPFMYTHGLGPTFSGSRDLFNGGATTISFKNLAYHGDPDPARRENAPWYIDVSGQSREKFSANCNFYRERGCTSLDKANNRWFDFTSHMIHEMGHVFGFIGSNLETMTKITGLATDSAFFPTEWGTWRRFKFAADQHDHAATNNMRIGFSSNLRAYPDSNEVAAIKMAFGYKGTHLLTWKNITVKANSDSIIHFMQDSSFNIAFAEFSSLYGSMYVFKTCPDVEISIESPNATSIKLGEPRKGWYRDGFEREGLNGASHFNPIDSLSRLSNQPAKGLWKISLSNRGNATCELPGLALRLVEKAQAPIIKSLPKKLNFGPSFQILPNRQKNGLILTNGLAKTATFKIYAVDGTLKAQVRLDANSKFEISNCCKGLVFVEIIGGTIDGNIDGARQQRSFWTIPGLPAY